MHMRKLWLVLGILAAPVVLPLTYALVAYVVLSIFGYHPDAIGQELARELAKSGGDPRECFQIIHPLPHPFSPTAGEQRGNCIYEYAKLTRDPSACELLMPSEYGWDCLGAVKSELWKGLGCGSTEENINCGAYDVFSKNLGISDCTIYEKRVLRDWCHEERTATLNDAYECNEISPDPPGLREACQRRYAFKLRNPALCTKISDEKRRTLCEIEIDAWQKYSKGWSFSKENAGSF